MLKSFSRLLLLFWTCFVIRIVLDSTNPIEDAQFIESRVGFDLSRVAADHEFVAQLQIDNGKGKYLVHIGQVHKIPKASQATIEEVIKVQKDIESLLLELINRPEVNDRVFLEALSLESRKLWESIQNLSLHMDKLDELVRNADALLGKQAKPRIRETRERDFYQGAAVLLALDGKIKVEAAEDLELNLKAADKVRNGFVDPKDPDIHINRERMAILLAMPSINRSEKKIQLLIFGAAHDFTRAVQEYNNENPNNKLGLVRLLPRHLK